MPVNDEPAVAPEAEEPPLLPYLDVVEEFLRMHLLPGEQRLLEYLVKRVEERWSACAEETLAAVLEAARQECESCQLEPVIACDGEPLERLNLAVFFSAAVCEIGPEGVSRVTGVSKTELADRVKALRAALGDGRMAHRETGVLIESELQASLAPSVLWNDDGAPRLSLPPPVGRLLGDRYRLVRRVAGGGVGMVYEAVDTRLAADSEGVAMRRVAIKYLRRPCRTLVARKEALREISAAAACFHPAIAQVWDYGWDGEHHLYFAMPWLEGETLAARLNDLENEPMSRDEAERIFVPLAGALARLHEAGICHDDVKPDNVMLVRLTGDATETPVLIDLGMARDPSERRRGCTPYWMEPSAAEQLHTRLVARSQRGAAHVTAAGEPSEPAKPDTPDEPRPGALPDDDGGGDVFALALMVRDALQPPAASASTGGSKLVDQLRWRAREPVPPLTGNLRDLQGHLAPFLAAGTRPSAAELGRVLARELPRARERRARRVVRQRIAILSVVLAAALAFTVDGELEAKAQEERHREQHDRELRDQTTLARRQAAQAAEERRQWQVRAAELARQAEAAEQNSNRQVQAIGEATRRAERAIGNHAAVAQALSEVRDQVDNLNTALRRTRAELRAARTAETVQRANAFIAQQDLAVTRQSLAAVQRNLIEERRGRSANEASLTRQLADLRTLLAQRDAEVTGLRSAEGVRSAELSGAQARETRLREQLEALRNAPASCPPPPAPTPCARCAPPVTAPCPPPTAPSEGPAPSESPQQPSDTARPDQQQQQNVQQIGAQ